MTFWKFISVDQQVELQGITEGLATRFSQLVSRGHSVADLLAHYADEFGHLPAERLAALHQTHRRFVTWRKRRTQLERARKQARLRPLPSEIFDQATTPDQLDAVFRAARLCSRRTVGDEPPCLEILRAGIDLWKRCLGLARKLGAVRCGAAPEANIVALSRFDPYLGTTEPLDEIAPHRWLALRRGQREGVLSLSLELPDDKLLEQVELLQPRLGPSAAERAPSALLDELVRDDLPSWLFQVLDSEAESRAVEAASQALAGLLRSSPVQARRIAAIHLTRPAAAAAVVIADREGELLAHRVLKAEANWLQKVKEFISDEHEVHQVILPTTAPSAELLGETETALGQAGLQVTKIRPAALAEARLPLTDPPHRLSVSLASALVLARRALDPLKEWSAVDPVAIGVAEYQNDLDTDRLRAALKQTVELCRLQRRRGKSAHGNAPTVRAGGAMARLNPLVKSLSDLRPGMTVHGLVTNISHFGAFISIGLPQEGLAHISELSDEYVTNPNEVVSIGQQVTAHVLAVDAPRGRISLSLKTRLPGREAREGRRAEPPSRAPKSKAEALASLERLFKK